MAWKEICFLVLGCGVMLVLSAPKRKVACELDDLSCTVLTADTLYKTIIRGSPDRNVPGSDPLYLKEISGRFDQMNYNLTDAQLFGLSKCNLKRHSINIIQPSWSFLLHCPQLVIKSNYVISGSLGGRPIEGRGESNIIQDKYRIGIHGGFQFPTDPKGKTHLRITHFDFDRLEGAGNIVFQLSNLYNGDVAKSEEMHKFLKENGKSISFYTQYPTMRLFMYNMFININKFLHVVPANELFFKEM